MRDLSWVLEHTAEGLLVLDGEGRVAHANTAACGILRQSAEQLSGTEFWDLLPGEAAASHQEAAVRALEAGRPYAFAHHLEFEGLWLEFRVAGAAEGTVVSVRDATAMRESLKERRKADRERRKLFDANPNAMWVFDANTLRILAVNEAAIMFYGYPPDEFIGMHVSGLYPEEDAEMLPDNLPGLGSVYTFGDEPQLGRQRKRSGEVVLAEFAGNLLDWDGVRAVIVAVSDVTRRFVTESSLRQQNEDLEERITERTRALEQSTRELEIFSYSVSHDLLSPLHAVDGFTKTLQDRYASGFDEKGLHYLNRIQASTRQMAKLVEDLSRLARVSRMSLTPRCFDATSVCRMVVETLRQQEPGRDVTLEIDPPLMVVGDQGLLAKAFMSLLENAWKFTAHKPQAWIHVGILPADDPGATIVFVSDNGEGFDPAYQHKLFRAFQRLHSAADFPGTGLGLAIVRRIVSRHGGRVWAESTPGSGATFFMMLPHGVEEQAAPLPAPESSMVGLL